MYKCFKKKKTNLNYIVIVKTDLGLSNLISVPIMYFKSIFANTFFIIILVFFMQFIGYDYILVWVHLGHYFGCCRFIIQYCFLIWFLGYLSKIGKKHHKIQDDECNLFNQWIDEKFTLFVWLCSMIKQTISTIV
jgi:hypothetical protein